MITSKKMNLIKGKEELENPQILTLNDDYSLIQKFLNGEESCFETLLKRHKEKVRSIIYLTLKSSAPVDDITQDVFITVYKNLYKFRFQSQFTTWLYRITVNKCKDHLRKVKLRNIFLPIQDEEIKTGYLPDHEGSEIASLVRDAIEKLPGKLRLPLLLRDIEGLSYQEISEIVNCELGTVKSRIFRARESLREILKPYEEELI
jgi:RNA polymerase sigma-70 factor, ECF subfamily